MMVDFGSRSLSGEGKFVKNGEGVQGGMECGNRNKDRVDKWISLLLHVQLFCYSIVFAGFCLFVFLTLVDDFIGECAVFTLFPHLPPTPTTSSGPSSPFHLAFMTPSSIIIFGMWATYWTHLLLLVFPCVWSLTLKPGLSSLTKNNNKNQRKNCSPSLKTTDCLKLFIWDKCLRSSPLSVLHVDCCGHGGSYVLGRQPYYWAFIDATSHSTRQNQLYCWIWFHSLYIILKIKE